MSLTTISVTSCSVEGTYPLIRSSSLIHSGVHQSRAWHLTRERNSAARRLFLQQASAFAQLCNVQVGYEPIGHTGLGPVDQVISLTRQLLLFFDRRLVRRPDKQINEVQPALINQSRNWAIVEVVQAAAD